MLACKEFRSVPAPGANGLLIPLDRWQLNRKTRKPTNFRSGDLVQPAMKTMTLRALFTLAILAGLAAAPGAQTFRWEPNSRSYDVGDRVGRCR